MKGLINADVGWWENDLASEDQPTFPDSSHNGGLCRVMQMGYRGKMIFLNTNQLSRLGPATALSHGWLKDLRHMWGGGKVTLLDPTYLSH